MYDFLLYPLCILINNFACFHIQPPKGPHQIHVQLTVSLDIVWICMRNSESIFTSDGCQEHNDMAFKCSFLFANQPKYRFMQWIVSVSQIRQVCFFCILDQEDQDQNIVSCRLVSFLRNNGSKLNEDYSYMSVSTSFICFLFLNAVLSSSRSHSETVRHKVLIRSLYFYYSLCPKSILRIMIILYTLLGFSS